MSLRYEPFNNAEEVWFWYCSCLLVRGNGLRSKSDYPGLPRDCELGDIEGILKRMKADNCITNRHLRVLYRWGGLFCTPYYDRRAKKSEIILWEEAIRWFDVYLRAKNILGNL